MKPTNQPENQPENKFQDILPSFSLILETENLANASLEGLSSSLQALVNQDVSPTRANEVWLIESGDVPTKLLQQLCDRYPWLKLYQAPPLTGYYAAKMLGAQLATGDIVVYCDSDCIYEPHWLRTILMTFQQHPEIAIVAGETTTRGVGPYGTAMALTYIFPQYSGDTQLTPTSQYYLNNVAFRRNVLLTHPIPVELPLYRGNCVIHAYDLHQSGNRIWKQPQARATHAPPNGLSHFFWRFLLIGHDYYWQQRLLKQSKQAQISAPSPANPDLTMSRFTTKLQTFGDRITKMVQNDPRHAFFLPLAIPAATTSVLLILLGYLVTSLKPNYLLVSVFNFSLSSEE
jgi:glycosyltransferase involved in cell wall biosynthesis